MVFNLNVCTIKTSLVINIQRHGHTSLCRKLSKVLLCQFYTVLRTLAELIMHVLTGVGMNIFKFLKTLKKDNEK